MGMDSVLHLPRPRRFDGIHHILLICIKILITITNMITHIIAITMSRAENSISLNVVTSITSTD